MKGVAVRVARLIGPFLGMMLAGLAVTVVAAPVSAASTTRWVAKDGKAGPTSCDGTRKASKTIQGAIDAAKPGDTVVVCDGTYREALSISGVAKERLTVKAAKPGKAVLRTPSTIAGVLVGITDTSTIAIAGLAVQVDTAAPCGRVTDAFLVSGSDHVALSGITIAPRGTATLGTCGYEVGVHVTASDPVTVKSARITDFQKNAVLEEGGSRLTVKTPTFRFLHAKAPAGSYCPEAMIRTASSTLTVAGGTLSGMASAASSTPCASSGITALSSPATVTGTTIRYVESGIVLTISGVHTLTDVTVTDGRGFYAGNGIDLRAADATVTRAKVTRMAGMGISVSGSQYSHVVDGDFRGNTGYDCYEGPTGNEWTNDLGDDSLPVGLCTTPA
ncbi:MAG: hypothetical protein U0869_24100 [Chloroflexota bacterium]